MPLSDSHSRIRLGNRPRPPQFIVLQSYYAGNRPDQIARKKSAKGQCLSRFWRDSIEGNWLMIWIRTNSIQLLGQKGDRGISCVATVG